jgi:aminoglycoside phosphotransferase
MQDRPWPEAVDRLVGPTDEPVVRRGPARWSVGSMSVLRLDGPGAGPAAAERLERIGSAATFAVPTVRGADGPWLVTERPPGIPVDQPERHPDPGALAGLVGVGLRALHGLSPSLADRCPPPSASAAWDGVVERCRRSVAAGRVDASTLPPPYDRYSPERLLELLVEGRPATDEAPVLCHGGPGLDRCLVDGERFAGFDGLEAVVIADRHLDLAVVHLEVAATLGAEAVVGLHEGYGTDPDLVRLEHYVLAVHLLGADREAPTR